MLDKKYFELLSEKPKEFKMIRAFQRIFIAKETEKFDYEYDRIILSDDVKEYFDKEGKTVVLVNIDFENLNDTEIKTLSALSHGVEELDKVVKIYPDYTKDYELFKDKFCEPSYIDVLLLGAKFYLVIALNN
jgi:hypothetical protein